MLSAHGESPHQAAATLSYPGTWENSRVIQHGPRSPQIKDAELAAKVMQTVHIYHLRVIRKALKLHTHNTYTCTHMNTHIYTCTYTCAHTHAHLQLWGQTQTEQSMLWPLFLQTSSRPFPLDSTTLPTPHPCSHCKTYKPISGQCLFPFDRTRTHPAPSPPLSLKYLYIRPHPPSVSFDMTVATEIYWILFKLCRSKESEKGVLQI